MAAAQMESLNIQSTIRNASRNAEANKELRTQEN
jgi:hypothetical protein